MQRRRRLGRLRRLLWRQTQIQDCQWKGERKWRGRSGGRLGAMGWSKHSIPNEFNVIKATNILEMQRCNEVGCCNGGAIHVCKTCMVVHCEMKDCKMSWVSRLGYFRFSPCLAAAFKLDIQTHCYYYADFIIQQSKVHKMKNRLMNSSPIQCVASSGWYI